MFADKLGTVIEESGAPCVIGNYFPVCVDGAKFFYAVKGLWAEALWQQRKLGHDTYSKYVMLCCDGYIGRKRALDAVRKAEQQAATEQEAVTNTKRIKATLLRPFKVYPELLAWLAMFSPDAPDRLRFF